MDGSGHTTGKPRGRQRGILGIALTIFLLVVGAAPVLAATNAAESSEVAGGVADPASVPAPTAAEIAAAEERQQEQEEWLAGPQAEKERAESQDAFAELSAGESEELLVEAFPEALASLNADPGRVLSRLEVEKTVGTHAAIVGNGEGGERQLVETSMPVESDLGGEGEQPVDLALEPSGNGFAPANPLTELQLPATAEGQVVLEEGVKIELPASDDHEAVPLGEANLFIPETEASTDTLLSPIAGGVEVSEQLRSAEAPEEFPFDLELPAGSQVEAAADGGAEIVAASGAVLEKVLPPTAVDAQGAAVPAELEVSNDGVSMRVPHGPSAEVAYPILADPVFVTEGGNFGYWGASNGEGYTLRNLGSSLNAYSEPNRWYGANTYAQWVYEPPGETSFIAAGYFNPVDFVSGGCNTSQPHGYVGLYNVNSGSFPSLGVYSGGSSTSTFETGWVGSPGTRYAVIGIGAGNSKVEAISCYHEIYVGGYLIQLEDAAQPVLSVQSSDQWIDNFPIRLNVSASDTGLGVQRFKTEAIDMPGDPSWENGLSCEGTWASRCPSSWNLGEGSQPMLNFNPAAMREGIDQLKITAYDPVEEPSAYSDTLTVRVDHSPPALTVSGTVTEQATLGTERPNYTIKAIAEDGVPNSENPADARSGVKNLRFFEDGTEIEPGRAQPECSGTQSCKAAREYEIPTLSRSVGVHHLLVTSEDALGHPSKWEGSYTITRDATSPEISVDGMPEEGAVVGSHPAEYSAKATDAGRGVTSLAFEVDGETIEEATQACPHGGCSLEGSAAPDLTEVSPGEHVLTVTATDAGGNQSAVSRHVTVENAPPALELSGTLAEHDAEPLEAEHATLRIDAHSPGITPAPLGLVAAYSLDEGEGTTAGDATGHGHTGTVEGAGWTTGHDGGALGFDGNESCVSVPVDPELQPTGEFTLEAWVRPVHSETEAQPVIALLDPEAWEEGEEGFAYYLLAGGEEAPKAWARKGEEGGYVGVYGQAPLAEEEWAHIALTDDESQLRLYVDGELVDTGTAPHHLGSASGPLTIGCDVWGGDFDGKIDDVRIYDRALGEGEIGVDEGRPVSKDADSEKVDAPISSIGVELDEEEVAGYPISCTTSCQEFTGTYEYDAASVGPGPHTLTVEAANSLGVTTSRTISVDVPEDEAGTPACSAEAEEEQAISAVSATEAVEAVEEVMPEAVAPSEPGPGETGEEQLDPTFSTPQPNLVAEGTPAKSETSVSPTGGVSLQGVACITLGTTTSSATKAKVVNSDAAVFANTGAEADTVVRPTAGGVMIDQSIRGPESSEFELDVKVHEGDELIQLPSGAIAIVEPEIEGAGGEGGQIEVDQSAAPEGIGQPSSLADADSQREEGEYELALAGSEISGTVVAVIAEPWILLANEEIIPAHIEIAPVIEEPNEYIVHYRLILPTGEQAAAVYPVEATAIASVLTGEGGCILRRSPCNEPDLASASKYAEFWANPNRVVNVMEAYKVYARNPFYENFGANNCTNFISQILRAGGEKWMRWDHSGSEAWWYKREVPWEPENELEWYGPAFHSRNWPLADELPRFLWQYGYVHIDPVDEPWGWTQGDILAESWFSDGGDEFNHLQYVVGTTIPPGGTREPLIANSSEPREANYGALRWSVVKGRIQSEEPSGWARVPLAWKHTEANADEKLHDPANLYGPGGVFHG
jgi:hypothetical protein